MESWRRTKIGALKDAARIGFAHMTGDFPYINIAVLKATRHDEIPGKEKYILTALAAAAKDIRFQRYLRHCLEERIERTKNWMVTLKTLALVHRLMTDALPIFTEEQLQNSSYATLLLDLSVRFNDRSSPSALDSSLWIRKYSCYLAQRLHCNRILNNEIVLEKQKDLDIEKLLEDLRSLQLLLDCLLDCTPQKCPVAVNFLIQYALDLLQKECSNIYPAINVCVSKQLDSLVGMPRHTAQRFGNIYKEIMQQSEKLSDFFHTCEVIVRHGRTGDGREVGVANIIDEKVHERDEWGEETTLKKPEALQDAGYVSTGTADENADDDMQSPFMISNTADRWERVLDRRLVASFTNNVMER